MEITLGHVWYYMMYINTNASVKFWGWINMLINTNSFILVDLITIFITTYISFYFFKSFGIKTAYCILIGIFLSHFVVFSAIVKQSSDITQYSFEYANQAYLADKNSFLGYETFIINK